MKIALETRKRKARRRRRRKKRTTKRTQISARAKVPSESDLRETTTKKTARNIAASNVHHSKGKRYE